MHNHAQPDMENKNMLKEIIAINNHFIKIQFLNGLFNQEAIFQKMPSVNNMP
jgi:hypothetical protein